MGVPAQEHSHGNNRTRGLSIAVLSEEQARELMPQLFETVRETRIIEESSRAFVEIMRENNVNNLSNSEQVMIVAGVIKLSSFIKKGTVHPNVIRAAFISKTKKEVAKAIFNDDTFYALGVMYWGLCIALI